jgi:fibronectin type 3 domain-containing protein
MAKRFSFSVHSSFQPHFNYSVGEYVTSLQHFKDTLSRKGDLLSERLGTEHRYAYHDHNDKLGVTPDD